METQRKKIVALIVFLLMLALSLFLLENYIPRKTEAVIESNPDFFAASDGDSSADPCDKVDDKNQQENCISIAYFNLAREKKDPAICDQITNKKNKKSCLLEAAKRDIIINDNSAICDSLESDQSSECIAFYNLKLQETEKQFNDAAFVKFIKSTGQDALIPDDVYLEGELKMTMMFTNKGTATWKKGNYSLKNIADASWGNASVSLIQDVAPGEEMSFLLAVPAPESEGAYAFQWQLQQGSVLFGQPSLELILNVKKRVYVWDVTEYAQHICTLPENCDKIVAENIYCKDLVSGLPAEDAKCSEKKPTDWKKTCPKCPPSGLNWREVDP